MSDPYTLLDVSRTATADEIRRAYKRKALKVHPDKGGTVADFQAVKEAFEKLDDPVERAKIDNELNGGVSAIMTADYAEERMARDDVGGVCSMCGGEKVVRIAGSVFWSRKPCPKCQGAKK